MCPLQRLNANWKRDVYGIIMPIFYWRISIGEMYSSDTVER